MGDKWKTEQIIRALQETDGLVSLAATQLGCVPMTIYKRAKRCPMVQQAMDDARENLVDEAVKALRYSVTKCEGWAVALVVKTLGKNRGYVERQEVTGKDGGEVTIRILRDGLSGTSTDATREAAGIPAKSG